MDKIKFNQEVTSVQQLSPGKWKVQTKSGLDIECDAVSICNGHYEMPNVPEIEGRETFEGVIMHSHDYKEPK